MQNFDIIKKIKSKIDVKGYITLYEFLKISLYDKKYGFYNINKELIGNKGHFITGPEISQMFGELIAVWLIDFCTKLNFKKINLIELGPGNGTLMGDILRVIKNIFAFNLELDLHFLEKSPDLKIKQEKLISKYNLSTHWHKNFDSLEKKIKNLPSIFIANEFFDCLPIQQYKLIGDQQWNASDWKKVCIKFENNQFCFKNLSLNKNENNLIKKYLNNFKDIFHDKNKVRFLEFSPVTNEIVSKISRLIKEFNGGALFIDYGKNNPFGDTLQALYKNRKISIFEKIGISDYTSLVDFSNIYNLSKDSGLTSYPPITQRDFFLELGIFKRLEILGQNCSTIERRNLLSSLDRLISKKQMGEVFKVFCMTKETLKPIGFLKSNKDNIYDNSFIP